MNSTVWVPIALVFAIGIQLTALRATGEEPESARAESSATIQNRTIQLKPSGAEFEIPEAWLAWHAQFKNNLHLTRAELEKVKNAEGDWDKEYAEVLNAVIPFARCAVHVGGEGWGGHRVSRVIWRE